jgi:hypothetical protein
MGWVVSITPRPLFTPGERTTGTHCTGGWEGPRAGLDTEVRGKPLLLSGIEPRSPGCPVRSQDTILTELHGSYVTHNPPKIKINKWTSSRPWHENSVCCWLKNVRKRDGLVDLPSGYRSIIVITKRYHEFNKQRLYILTFWFQINYTSVEG